MDGEIMADQWEEAAKQFKPDPNAAPAPTSSGNDDWRVWQQNESPAPQQGLAGQAANFTQEHPYITAAASLLPGVGGLIGGLTDPTGQVGRGALKKAGRDLYDVTEGAGPLGMAAHFVAEKTGLGDKIRKATEPNNPQQEVGGYGTTAAELALPLPKAAGMLPTTEKAGKLFQEVGAKANNVPVDVSRFAQPALDARRLNRIAGDPYPPVLRKAFEAVQPSTNPLTYGDARLLAGSAGRKAVNMSMQPQRLTGPMGMHAAQLAKGLDEANAGAAASVGMGDKYRQAMTTYRRAKALEKGVDVAKKVGTGAALAGGGYEGGKYAVRRLLGE